MESNNNKLIEWLKSDFDDFKSEMKSEINTVSEKMDEMLKFKWQIVGGSIVVSAVVGVFIQIGIALFGRH